MDNGQPFRQTPITNVDNLSTIPAALQLRHRLFNHPLVFRNLLDSWSSFRLKCQYPAHKMENNPCFLLTKLPHYKLPSIALHPMLECLFKLRPYLLHLYRTSILVKEVSPPRRMSDDDDDGENVSQKSLRSTCASCSLNPPP